MLGRHPRTTAWAVLKLEIAFLRLAWEVARALRINKLFGIPNRKGGT